MPSALRNRSLPGKVRGITIIELLIVLVIVGILASVAYPNYREFAARAKRTEAVAALLLIEQNQESFYLSNNTFTDDLTNLGFGASDNAPTRSGTYTVSVTAADAAGFSATATYTKDDGEKSKCETFTITNGVRTSSPDTDCWTRTR